MNFVILDFFQNFIITTKIRKKKLKTRKKNQFLQKTHSKSQKSTKKLVTLDFKSK
jgi:hypothetical protein